MNVYLPVLGAMAVLAAFFAVLIRLLLQRTDTSSEGIEWLSEFSVERYRPMERLLSETDYEFLASQPGYHPRIAQELRSERRRIFQSYLRSLIRDFNALIRLAQLMIVYSPTDRPDLARKLLRLRWQFYTSVIAVEFRLALSPLPVGSIDAKRLINSLALVRENIELLAFQRHSA